MTAPSSSPSQGRPDNVIRLRDGRILGYAEYGDPSGSPAFIFHGFPGSRLEAALAHEAAIRAHVRVICPDRPGMGLSTFQPGRTMLDWPSDVMGLADALGVDRFAVGGISGGGPYAAACAFRIADRLTGAAIISGIGPPDVPGAAAGMHTLDRGLLMLARRAPWLVRLPMLWMARATRSPDRAMERMSRSMSPPDSRCAAAARSAGSVHAGLG
jgi:pimeloyl-ACP methyl ester carboxylesterase